jgi:hypothetical protein
MKKLVLAALAAAVLSFGTSARAEDLSGFYRWAQSVTVKVETTGGVFDGTEAIVIRVGNTWDNEVPEAYRLWYPTYAACHELGAEMEHAQSYVKRFYVYVILADPAPKINSDTSAVIPNVRGQCQYQLEQMNERINGK